MATALANQDKAKRARELATTMASEKATTQERIRAAHGLIDIYTPELVRSLPGLAGATVPLFEARPRPDGAKRPNSRHYPKTLSELLTAPEPRAPR